VKNKRFKTFFQHVPYLEVEELISYFAVFDGFHDLRLLSDHENLLQNIKQNILKEFQKEKKEFIFTSDKALQTDIETTLHRLATGTRKHYSIYKDLSQSRGREVYKVLYDLNLIIKEPTREKPLNKHLGPLKKELRRYQREDKIRFSKEYFRFWFTFIYPHYDDLEKNEYNPTLKVIEKDLDYFISSYFEELSNALIVDIYKNNIKESGGYWDKDVEIDLFVKLQDGRQIVGECKWKNHKVSKNTLNKLKKVTEKAGLKADLYALFSKNGFSKELEKGSEKEVLLYNLDAFKRLLS
jgi:hypothetical protein